MRLRVLGGYGSEGPGQPPSPFLAAGRVLVDAGTVGGVLSVPEQIAIEHAVLSHAHLDHTVGLAFLVDTLAVPSAPRAAGVRVWPLLSSSRGPRGPGGGPRSFAWP